METLCFNPGSASGLKSNNCLTELSEIGTFATYTCEKLIGADEEVTNTIECRASGVWSGEAEIDCLLGINLKPYLFLISKILDMIHYHYISIL